MRSSLIRNISSVSVPVNLRQVQSNQSKSFFNSNSPCLLSNQLRSMGSIQSFIGLKSSDSKSPKMDLGGGGAAQQQLVNDQQLKTNIEELVNQEKIVIFSKESCPYCYDAKNVFDKMGEKYAVVELNQHPQASDVQNILNDMTGARTVPRVFVEGKCIGGGSDTVQLFKSGQLKAMLSGETSLTQ